MLSFTTPGLLAGHSRRASATRVLAAGLGRLPGPEHPPNLHRHRPQVASHAVQDAVAPATWPMWHKPSPMLARKRPFLAVTRAAARVAPPRVQALQDAVGPADDGHNVRRGHGLPPWP